MGDFSELDSTRRAIAGDHEALSQCWRDHRRWLLTVLLAHRPAGADAEDLLQEVAVRVVREIAKVEDPAALRGWLRAIALNVARSAGRRAGQRDCESLVAEPVDPRPADQAFRAAAEERIQRVMLQVNGLRAEYREPLLLKAVHGWSQKQIAATLGVAETTVETRLSRARRALRACESSTNTSCRERPCRT